MAAPKPDPRPTFDVTADDTETGETKTFTFARRPVIQGDVLLEYFEATEQGNIGGAIRNLVQSCLTAEDQEPYRELVRSERFIVSMSALADVANGLVGAYSARPSKPSPSS